MNLLGFNSTQHSNPLVFLFFHSKNHVNQTNPNFCGPCTNVKGPSCKNTPLRFIENNPWKAEDATGESKQRSPGAARKKEEKKVEPPSLTLFESSPKSTQAKKIVEGSSLTSHADGEAGATPTAHPQPKNPNFPPEINPWPPPSGETSRPRLPEPAVSTTHW
jgi:hypothetical protein